jgi:hypothetical protein
MSNIVDTYVGGIEIPTVGETFITGGGKVTRVVNYYAKFNTKDRLLEYKHSDKRNVKELLNIIGLSIPITFDSRVYYDDQGSEEYDKHKSVNSGDRILSMLKSRLYLNFKSLVQLKVREYKLKEIAELAMIELISYLVRYIKRNNKAANMRKIKISRSVSEMLDNINGGKNLFTVIAVGDHEEFPSNLSEVILHMIDMVSKQKPRRGKWPAKLNLINPQYPSMCKKINASVGKLRNTIPSTANKMVYAILMVDHALLPHLVQIEQYYTDVANDVQVIHKALKTFLS